MADSAAFTKASAYDSRPFIQNLAQGAGLALSAKLGVQSDWDVLDFGCGTGLVAERIAGNVRHVVGVDTDQGMIAVLSDKVKNKGLSNVTTCCVQLSSPDSLEDHFSKNSVSEATPTKFDLIYSSMTLHHIENISGLIEVAQSYLKPHGLLVAFDLEKSADSMLFHPQPVSPSVQHAGGFTSDQLCEMWRNAGLHDVSCEQVHRFKKEVEVDKKQQSVAFWMLMVKGSAS